MTKKVRKRMNKLKFNPNNAKYYSDDFIKGFECGVERQFNADMSEKTAEWIYKTPKSAKCSNCGYLQYTNGEDLTKNVLIHKAIYHYCPNCGAKMKEESEVEE